MTLLTLAEFDALVDKASNPRPNRLVLGPVQAQGFAAHERFVAWCMATGIEIKEEDFLWQELCDRFTATPGNLPQVVDDWISEREARLQNTYVGLVNELSGEMRKTLTLLRQRLRLFSSLAGRRYVRRRRLLY